MILKLAKYFVGLAAFGLLLMSQTVSHAQNAPFEIQNQRKYIAVGIGAAPDYLGSDDYQFVAAPAAKYTFQSNRFIELIAFDVSANVISHEYFIFGPSINYRFGRDDDVDDNVVKLMTEVDDAFEAGAFVGLDFTNKVNPRYRFRTQLKYLQDVSDAHDGFTLELSTRYWMPISKMFDIGLGLGLTYASEDFMKTNFSVNSTDAGLSGLSEFSASDGLMDVNTTVALVAHLSKSWHLGGFMKYRSLLSDASDSPVVDDRGSSNQFIAGLGLAYSW